jgi:glutamyl/glutaminyl-tRNA synthetase
VEFYETSSGDLVELKAFVKSILKEYSAKFPDIGRFVRFGLTGVVEGPGMYDLLLFLPKEEAVERIKLLLSKLS